MFRDPLHSEAKKRGAKSASLAAVVFSRILSSALDMKALTPPRIAQVFTSSNLDPNHKDYFGSVAGSHLHPGVAIATMVVMGALTLTGAAEYFNKKMTLDLEDLLDALNSEGHTDITYEELLNELKKEEANKKVLATTVLNQLSNLKNLLELNSVEAVFTKKYSTQELNQILAELENIKALDEKKKTEIEQKFKDSTKISARELKRVLLNHLEDEHYLLSKFLLGELSDLSVEDCSKINKHYFSENPQLNPACTNFTENTAKEVSITSKIKKVFQSKLKEEGLSELVTPILTLKESLIGAGKVEFELRFKDTLQTILAYEYDSHKSKTLPELYTYIFENVSTNNNDGEGKDSFKREESTTSNPADTNQGLRIYSAIIEKYNAIPGVKQIELSDSIPYTQVKDCLEELIGYEAKAVTAATLTTDLQTASNHNMQAEKYRAFFYLLDAFVEETEQQNKEKTYKLNFNITLEESRKKAIERLNELSKSRKFFKWLGIGHQYLDNISYKFWLAFGPVDLMLDQADTSKWPFLVQLIVITFGFVYATLEAIAEAFNAIRYRVTGADLNKRQAKDDSRIYTTEDDFQHKLLSWLGIKLREEKYDQVELKDFNTETQSQINTKVKGIIEKQRELKEIKTPAIELGNVCLKGQYEALEEEIRLIESRKESNFLKIRPRYNFFQIFNFAISFSFISWVAGVFFVLVKQASIAAFLLSNPVGLAFLGVGMVVGGLYALYKHREAEAAERQLLALFTKEKQRFEELILLEEKNAELEKLAKEQGLVFRILHPGNDTEMRRLQKEGNKTLIKRILHFFSLLINKFGTGVLVSRLYVLPVVLMVTAAVISSPVSWALIAVSIALGLFWFGISYYDHKQNSKLAMAKRTLNDLNNRIELSQVNNKYLLKLLNQKTEGVQAEKSEAGASTQEDLNNPSENLARGPVTTEEVAIEPVLITANDSSREEEKKEDLVVINPSDQVSEQRQAVKTSFIPPAALNEQAVRGDKRVEELNTKVQPTLGESNSSDYHEVTVQTSTQTGEKAEGSQTKDNTFRKGKKFVLRGSDQKQPKDKDGSQNDGSQKVVVPPTVHSSLTRNSDNNGLRIVFSDLGVGVGLLPQVALNHAGSVGPGAPPPVHNDPSEIVGRHDVHSQNAEEHTESNNNNKVFFLSNKKPQSKQQVITPVPAGAEHLINLDRNASGRSEEFTSSTSSSSGGVNKQESVDWSASLFTPPKNIQIIGRIDGNGQSAHLREEVEASSNTSTLSVTTSASGPQRSFP